MAKPFNIGEVRPYILDQDRNAPPEQQTVFQLGVVDSALHSYLWDSNTYVKDEEGQTKPVIQVRAFSKLRDTVKFCLKGWENFGEIVFDKKIHTQSYGAPIPSLNGKPREGLTDRTLDLLKPYINELASAIEKEATLSEQDEKN